MLSHTTTVCVCQCVCVCECVFKFQCTGNMLSFSPFCNPFFTYSKWEAEKTEYIHPCKTVKLPMVPSSLHTACVSQCVCVLVLILLLRLSLGLGWGLEKSQCEGCGGLSCVVLSAGLPVTTTSTTPCTGHAHTHAVEIACHPRSGHPNICWWLNMLDGDHTHTFIPMALTGWGSVVNHFCICHCDNTEKHAIDVTCNLAYLVFTL